MAGKKTGKPADKGQPSIIAEVADRYLIMEQSVFLPDADARLLDMPEILDTLQRLTPNDKTVKGELPRLAHILRSESGESPEWWLVVRTIERQGTDGERPHWRYWYHILYFSEPKAWRLLLLNGSRSALYSQLDLAITMHEFFSGAWEKESLTAFKPIRVDRNLIRSLLRQAKPARHAREKHALLASRAEQ